MATASYPTTAYPPAMSKPAAPPGTFAPGTKVQVGSHRVVIEKYLSEGGFAHVYVVRVPTPDGKHTVAVLKRVAAPDKDALANMRTEVETMKRLQGHKHIVRYFDSHASQLKGGGYEVFLLMEFCSGGGLIDFMNTRLQHRLTEPEILTIFGHVSEGLATMHYLKPPLLHRDLKVENVLITTSSSGAVVYKLCDFGSTAPPRPAATTATEGRLIEEDIQKHTTMQYRSPEMVDVWRRLPIDEKSDIWALGVLLYKLCYYTTPFEDVGQMAILNATYKYPQYPQFSDRIKRFIAWMLKEDPRQRPNIYQVVKEACAMRGTPVPIKDIYADRTQSEARQTQKLPSTSPISSPPPAGISHIAPVEHKPIVPEIAPMRRGRPTAPVQASTAAKPTPSPAHGDPFAALDSRDYNVRAGAVDELASRFPSIDDFSIVVDKKNAFQFPSARPSQPARGPDAKVNDRVTNALADEVFASTNTTRPGPQKVEQKNALPSRTVSLRKPDGPAGKPDQASKRSVLQQPAPVRPGYTSTGTMTSPSPPVTQTIPPPVKIKMPDISKRPIWRVPEKDNSRSSSQPRASPAAQAAADSLQPRHQSSHRPPLLDIHRSKSQTATATLASPASSRPSLEGRRISQLYTGESVSRARSANSMRPRPVSAAFVESNLDYLRTQERESAERKRPSLDFRRSSRSITTLEALEGETRMENDGDEGRGMERDKTRSRDSSVGHKKRASLPSLMGKFGDAFKRFERTKSSEGDPYDEKPAEPALRTPSPQPHGRATEYPLSPISGSEATATPPRHTEDAEIDVETEDLPPAMRRELERQRLVAEERRVAQAAEEYRTAKVAGAPRPPTKANAIQQRVQAFLDEGRQSPKPKRTAEGYGRYTETEQEEIMQTSPVQSRRGPPPAIARKPFVPQGGTPGNANPPLTYNKVRQSPQVINPPTNTATLPVMGPPPVRPASRPSAPPKPRTLMTGSSGVYQGRPSSSSSQSQLQAQAQAQSPVAQSQTQQGTGKGPSLAALLARDNEGVAEAGAGVGAEQQRIPEQAPSSSNVYGSQVEDWEADFSKRYPSLSGIEMVETEIYANDAPQRGGMRVKEV